MQLQRLAVLLCALAILGVVIASCGGDSEAPARPSEVPAGVPFVDQDDLRFTPGELKVKAGDRVYFANSETALHTVTIDGKNDSGTMKKGDVYVWAAPAAGTFKVTCDFHPQMRATITVE